MDSLENVNFKLSSKLVASEVSNETVILDYEAGKYFGLEGVGSFVWSLIQKEGTVNLAYLSKRVTEEYEVDEDASLADLKSLLSDLRKNGLIEPVS
jgi:hypothetical protein